MLFSVYDQFRDNPPALLAYLAAFAVAMVAGIAFHEFCHAWSAYELGDTTAANQGRLSLNPIRHLDPMGTILLLTVGFGMGKPTPVNPNRLRRGPVWGLAIVKAAGPASNFLIAAMAALPLKAGWIDSVADLNRIRDASGVEILGLFLLFVVLFNVLLGVFNLIPIPPLDGFALLVAFVPPEARPTLQRFESAMGYGLLMLLFILPFLTPYNPLGWVVGPMLNHLLPLFVDT